MSGTDRECDEKEMNLYISMAGKVLPKQKTRKTSLKKYGFAIQSNNYSFRGELFHLSLDNSNDFTSLHADYLCIEKQKISVYAFNLILL